MRGLRTNPTPSGVPVEIRCFSLPVRTSGVNRLVSGFQKAREGLGSYRRVMDLATLSVVGESTAGDSDSPGGRALCAALASVVASGRPLGIHCHRPVDPS